MKHDKAVRLVDDGRVHVGWVSSETNDAGWPVAGAGLVDGDTDTYRVAYSPFGRICTCPAGRTYRDCSHGIALELAATARALQLEILL